MDHLIVTSKPELKISEIDKLKIEALSLRDDSRLIIVPCLARREYMWTKTADKNNIYLAHGQKTGWDRRLETGNFGEFKVEDAISFLQSWLFFGMLEEILRTPIEIGTFVRYEDGKKYITTEQIMNLMHDWEVRIQRRSETEKRKYSDSIEMSLLGWKTFLTGTFPDNKNAWCCKTPDAEAILLSIRILGETLQWSKMIIFKEIELGKTIEIKGGFSSDDNIAGGMFLYEKMISEK